MDIVNINGLDRILCDHDDALTAKTVLYFDSTSPIEKENPSFGFRAYMDRECTIECTVDQLIDAYFKGLVIYEVNGGVWGIPPNMGTTADGKCAAVFIFQDGGTSWTIIAGDISSLG